MKFHRCFLSLILISALAKCQNKPNFIDSSSSRQIDQFFSRIKAGNYESALTDFLQSNPNINLEEFKLINQYSGEFLGYTLLKKRMINNDVAIYSYLAKYKRSSIDLCSFFIIPEIM